MSSPSVCKEEGENELHPGQLEDKRRDGLTCELEVPASWCHSRSFPSQGKEWPRLSLKGSPFWDLETLGETEQEEGRFKITIAADEKAVGLFTGHWAGVTLKEVLAKHALP